MSSRQFEPLGKARFHTSHSSGVECIVIPATRNWFALPFMAFWLTAWTLGGIGAITVLLRGEAVGFLSIWLVFWAFGWLFAASWLGWQIGGKHLLCVQHGALAYRWDMPFIGHTKRYDASQVMNLRSLEANSLFGFGGGMMRMDYPPFLPMMQTGTIRFDYGARTVRLVPGLDEAEGQLIIDWLAARLPRPAR